MPQQAHRGATTQTDPTATTYTVTIIEQRIYRMEVPVGTEPANAGGAEEAYDDVLGQMHRQSGQVATWEAPVYNPGESNEPIDED